jgi:hypothetical protein
LIHEKQHLHQTEASNLSKQITGFLTEKEESSVQPYKRYSEDKAMNEEFITFGSLEWKLLQQRLASLEERARSAESRLVALEEDCVTLDVELSTLEQIVKNTTTEQARQSIESWFQRRRLERVSQHPLEKRENHVSD